jgi:H3 lysine-79-specific histone-lysine N-methyltransferase
MADYIPITSSHIFGPLPSESLFGPSQSTPQRSTPLSSLPGTPSKASGSSTPQPQEVEETILRSLHKSINRHDGPGFVAAVTRFNEAVNRIREEGGFKRHLETTGWGARMKAADWEEMVDFVHDQAYSRVVGPFSNALEVSWKQ